MLWRSSTPFMTPPRKGSTAGCADLLTSHFITMMSFQVGCEVGQPFPHPDVESQVPNFLTLFHDWFPFSLTVAMGQIWRLGRCVSMLLTLFMKLLVAATRHWWVLLRSKANEWQKEDRVFLLWGHKALSEAYIHINLIAKSNVVPVCFTPVSNEAPNECSETIWNQALGCKSLYEE